MRNRPDGPDRPGHRLPMCVDRGQRGGSRVIGIERLDLLNEKLEVSGDGGRRGEVRTIGCGSLRRGCFNGGYGRRTGRRVELCDELLHDLA